MRFEGYRASSGFDLSNSQCGLTKDACWNGMFFETLECTFHSLCCIFVLLELQEPAKHLSNRSVDGLWPKKTYVWILYCDAPKGKERNGSMWQQTCSPHTVTSLSNLTFRCNFCHVQMYVQPILNSIFTNTSLCQHIYAKQIPSQQSSHHETLSLIMTVVSSPA